MLIGSLLAVAESLVQLWKRGQLASAFLKDSSNISYIYFSEMFSNHRSDPHTQSSAMHFANPVIPELNNTVVQSSFIYVSNEMHWPFLC